MDKKLLLIATMLILAFVVSAQKYRGFVDISGGFGVSGGYFYSSDAPSNFPKTNVFANAGISTTHGVQISPNLFAGIGLGAYIPIYRGSYKSYFDFDDYDDFIVEANGMTFPIFANVRWDFNIVRKCTPFVGIKAGYQICHVFSEDYMSYYKPMEEGFYETYLWPANGLYFETSVGIRFRISSVAGFNIALSYNPTISTHCETAYYAESYNDKTNVHSGKKNFGTLMLNLGFDF